MKTFTTIRLSALSLFAFILLSAASYGATFTAVASGNWSTASTWGGSAPSFTNTGDAVIIPSGITVTMDDNVTLSGALASLSVAGTLTGSSSTYLTIAAGTLSGAGTITTGYVLLGAGSLMTFTGNITTDNFASQALSIKSAATIKVNSKIALAAGVLSMETGGTLTLASNATIVIAGGQLVANGGTLTLTSVYNVEYDVAGSTGAELSGSGLNNVTINALNNGTVALSNDLSVKGTLTMTAGVLALGSHSLTITGDIASSGTGTISSTSASNITINTSGNVSGPLTFSGSDNSVNNLTVTVGSANHVQMNGSLTVSGTLTLNSGSLVMGANSNLIIKGDIAATGNGSISASPSSNITVNTSTSPTGALSLSTSSNVINALTVNITNGGTLKTGSKIVVNGILSLTNGKLDIGNNDLMIGSSGSVTGASSSKYIITSGSGSLAMALTAGATVATTYPIGTSDKYFPSTGMLAAGSTAGNVSARVMPHVYGQGFSGTAVSDFQSVVDATWDYKTEIASNLNLTIGLMWDASAEIHSFDRTHAYISHYTNGGWDMGTQSSATASGSMYMVTRANLTSLSPFAVFDKNTNAGVAEPVNNTTSFSMYPNPVKDQINITNASATANTYVEISNISGKVVGTYTLNGTSTVIPVNNLSNGCYFIKMYDSKSSVIQKFIKM